jgi:hypothetical protein
MRPCRCAEAGLAGLDNPVLQPVSNSRLFSSTGAAAACSRSPKLGLWKGGRLSRARAECEKKSACLVWCVTQELVSDNERLRLSASAARESAARQSDELKRLQRDNARMSPALVGSD